MDRRRAAGALLALAACIACTTAAPTASNQTALDLYESDASEGCYYNFQHYGEGDRIMTNEPCLNCTCHNRMLMCYLRVCPFTKPIGQDCTVEKRADQCCPIVTCPDVPVDLLTSTSTSSPAEYGTTGLGRLDKYGCSMNGKYFPEGSKVPPSPNKPCEHCYCIRNMTTCVMQECTLHVDGCTPIYHKDVCCPVRYSCDHPEDEIPLLDDMTTTVRPTPGFLLTTTTMPSVTQIPQDCVHDDKIFSDGALIKTEKACEHCYCMKGDIVCVVQECGTPMENEGKNCTSLAPKEGQCCPDTYICEGDNELQTDDITTLLPPRRTGVEGSGYRNEDEYTVQPTVFEPEVEGSGFEGSGQEGSDLEGSGDKERTEKPVSSSDKDFVPDESTSPIPIEKDESDMLITKTPVNIPISTEPSTADSEKYTTEPDKGQNTVPSEDETTIPSVRETTISSDDMHAPELDKDEKTSAEDEKTETPNEQEDKLATTMTPESQSSLPDMIVTPGEMSDHTDKTTPVENITLKQTEESVTDASEILEPLATTTEKQESFEIPTVIPLDEKQSKSTTVQLPDDAQEPDDSEQTHEVTTETLVKLSTAVDNKDKDSETTVLATEQDEQLSTSSIKYEIPEVTSVNPIENEIQEEVSPIASPGMIPGEGNCLVNGITYGNDSVVPSTNKCQANCKCMSSIVKCDPIICSGPPENMANCQPVYDTAETCCPTYICDHGKETIPPQPHSQMAGTESPATQVTDCMDVECRRQGDDRPSPTPSLECLAGDCLTEIDTKDSSDCGTGGCDGQPPIADPSKPAVTKQPEVCLDGNCISPPESCVGDNCQLPVHKVQSCGKDGECDVPHAQVCEGPNCDEDTKPPKEESPACANEDDCRQSAIPEVPIQTCNGEACEHVPTELPTGNVPQTECSDESCTKKEITDLETKYGPGCKDEACVSQTSEQPILETADVNTELPISHDESGVKVPVIEEDVKHTDVPKVVTELPESSVTEVQETGKEPEKMDVTELPISQEEAMVTKVSETVEPSVADTISTESLDSETKSSTDSQEFSVTVSSKIPEKEEEQEPATEEPLREGPVTEQQEIATKATKMPSVEEQEISSESPKITTQEPEFNTEAPEISEIPEVSEYPTTEKQPEISKSPEIPISEEHLKTTVLPETLATESEEIATKATEMSEDKIQKVSESPEIEKTDTVTKTSEGTVSDAYPEPESHEFTTKPSDQLPVTDTQEVATRGPETPDISEAAIDQATKVPQSLVPELQVKSTELPEATAHEVERTTEFYEKPEYPATDSVEKATIAPASEEEKIPESAVTKSEEETPISEQKPESPVTETMEPLREGSVTEPQNQGTETAETSASEAPELPVLITEETPQGPKVTEAPETVVTESKEKVTETEENATESYKKQEAAVTESEENVTEAFKEPQEADTESEDKLTEASKEPEVAVTETEDMPTEAPKEPETSVTASEEKVTEAPKEPEAVVTESEDKVTKASKEPETALTESENKITEAPKGPEPAVTELGEKITEAPKAPETAVTEFEEKVTLAPEVSIEKTTEAGEPSSFDAKKEQPVTEPQEKTTIIPDILTPVEEQESPESTNTEAQEPEVPESITSVYVPEVGVTESEVKATFAPETSQPSDEQQPCDKDSTCDVPLTKPCEGRDCGIDTPLKEIPMVCSNKDNCEQSPVAEVPVQTCDGESCKELPVSDDKQESPVTESTEKVTEASESPVFDEKQEGPELFITETQEKATESPEAPLPDSDDKKITESTAEEELEVSVTESDPAIREDSVTEPQEKATEAPETNISQEQPYPPTTDLEEKTTESPEGSLSEEKQQTTKSTVTEYSEKPTEAPEVPDLGQKPQVSEIPVIDLDENITEAPESSDENQEMPEQPVTEYTEKITEIPERPLSETQTERVPEISVTESAETAPESAEKTTAVPLSDEKQEIPELPATELEEKSTDKPLRESSVTESQVLGTEIPEISTAAPELPISEQEIEGLFTKPTETPVKQEIPESSVTDSDTESQEKVTESPQEQEQPLTEQHEVATKAPALQDDQQTQEPQEMGTKAPEVLTEDQDIRGDQPATEIQEMTPKVPEIVTSGEQDIRTEAPVSLVTGLQEQSGVPVSTVTESQEPTTRIQEAPVSEEQPTPMSPKATEAPQEPISEGPEVPETDKVKTTYAPITDKQDIPEESGTESVEKATEISITGSQDKTISTPEGTEKPDSPEISEKESDFPETQEKATETPDISALDEKHEFPVTESEEEAIVTLVESGLGEGEKTSKSPVTEFQDRVTEIPETTISEQEPKVPETLVTEADKPLREGSVTETQELGTETPEIPITAPETPESAVSESQPTEAESSATESEEKATVVPETPVSQEEPQAPETEEKATEMPEASVTEYQEKATVAPEIPEPQAPETERATESLEIPEASESPVTEYQEKATEIPKPIVLEELPQVPESEDNATKAPEVPLTEEEQVTLVTQPQEKATEAPVVPISGQGSESPEADTQEKSTEAPKTPASEDQELPIPSVTESQEPVSKLPDALTTKVPKQEYSETTPYLVELEEHTHKIEDEVSSIAPEDVTTTRIDEKPSEDTEKPIFIPDMETFSIAPTTAQEPLSTEAASLDSKFGEPSSIAPERTGENDEQETSVSDIETEKYTSAPSTEKPFESSTSPEQSAPEEESVPSRTTTTKPEEEATTPALLDKFTKPEPKPTEETVAPEVPKPTTTGQLSDDLPLPEDEAGQFPPSGGTGYGQEPDYVEEDQAFGPGTCRYGGKVYVSAQQIPRDDPCDFCFCFRSDIICLQQSCPPPIHGCHEEPISGFCCPRYECPVSMATTLNVTTTTTTTTTTLPPHFLPHAYKGQAQRRGCQIKGHTYKVGEVVRASSGPCLHCTCGGDGQMKCDPKQCTPEPMLRQMIAAAVSAKRRR